MTIIQLTPFISFEAPNNIFLLRASELKPRITAFIKEEFLNYYDGERKEEFKKLINNKEIFPEGRGCSYFKLLIESAYVKERYKFKTYIPKRERNNKFKKGSYFGDYDAIKVDEVKMEVVSFLKPLKELVEEAFKYFFVLYNLGARQNKGFGGFVVKGTSKEEFEEILKKKYSLIFVKDVENEFDALEVILNDYQVLKSGRNKPYKKSFLFQYFAKRDIGWEKKKVKEGIKEKCPNENIKGLDGHISNKEFKEYRFIRALLGLAGNMSFIKDDGNNNNKRKDKFIVNITHKKYKGRKVKIEKFTSPILFKIYKDKVYALPNLIPSEIFDEPFIFKAKSCDKKLCELYTPQEFNLEEFLREYLVKLNWREL